MTRIPTHTQILLRELDAHGRVTYQDLLDRYGGGGYSYSGFVVAVLRARRRGLIDGCPRDRYGEIVKAERCPCCGRPMRRQA